MGLPLFPSAPMPFLIGVHSSLMDRARKMPLGDIVIVDVDEGTHESSFDDVGELPEEVVTHLKHILKKQSSATGEAVAKAFLNAFAAMIGEYKSAFAITVTEGEVDVSSGRGWVGLCCAGPGWGCAVLGGVGGPGWGCAVLCCAGWGCDVLCWAGLGCSITCLNVIYHVYRGGSV